VKILGSSVFTTPSSGVENADFYARYLESSIIPPRYRAEGNNIELAIFLPILAEADGRLLGGLRKKAYLKDFR